MDPAGTPSGIGLTGDMTKRPASPSPVNASDGTANGSAFDDGPASKKLKTEESDQASSTERRKGIAPIKAEYVIVTLCSIEGKRLADCLL